MEFIEAPLPRKLESEQIPSQGGHRGWTALHTNCVIGIVVGVAVSLGASLLAAFDVGTLGTHSPTPVASFALAAGLWTLGLSLVWYCSLIFWAQPHLMPRHWRYSALPQLRIIASETLGGFQGPAQRQSSRWSVITGSVALWACTSPPLALLLWNGPLLQPALAVPAWLASLTLMSGHLYRDRQSRARVRKMLQTPYREHLEAGKRATVAQLQTPITRSIYGRTADVIDEGLHRLQGRALWEVWRSSACCSWTAQGQLAMADDGKGQATQVSLQVTRDQIRWGHSEWGSRLIPTEYEGLGLRQQALAGAPTLLVLTFVEGGGARQPQPSAVLAFTVAPGQDPRQTLKRMLRMDLLAGALFALSVVASIFCALTL